MIWTFIVMVLWLKNGQPEPHLIVIPEDVECSEEQGLQIWQHYLSVSEHSDQLTLDYAYACNRAKAPDGELTPDFDLPPGHPPIDQTPEPTLRPKGGNI